MTPRNALWLNHAIPVPDNSETGWSCGEVCTIAAMKYFGLPVLHESEARARSGKKPDHNTWPEQLVRVLRPTPLTARIHRGTPITSTAEQRLRSTYTPHAADLLIADSDLSDFANAIHDAAALGEYADETSLDDLCRAVRAGHIVIVLCDFEIMHGQPKQADTYDAHYVIVSGYGDDCVYIHECGSKDDPCEPFFKVDMDRFHASLGPEFVYITIHDGADRALRPAIAGD